MSNIISIKVKFVRNLSAQNFESNISDNEQKQVLELCLKATTDCGFKSAPLSEMSKKVVDNLLARDLLEHQFVYNSLNQGYAGDSKITIQINSVNHIEVFVNDNNLYNAYAKAKNVDKMLCNKLNFAYSDKYGFLTPDIKSIGSGMSIEAKVILPALAQVGAINKLPNINDKLIFDIACLDRQSGLCVITTRATLGYSEKQICELTKTYLDKIIQLEIDTAKKLASNDNDEILDKLNRAKAILKYCIKLSASEAYMLLGHILVGINVGIEKDIEITKINNALNCIKLYENDFKILAKEIQKILN